MDVSPLSNWAPSGQISVQAFTLHLERNTSYLRHTNLDSSSTFVQENEKKLSIVTQLNTAREEILARRNFHGI